MPRCLPLMQSRQSSDHAFPHACPACRCVIAEMFLDGGALFDLSSLLAYTAGKYHPAAMLAKVIITVSQMPLSRC